jgi:hypothetical protein
MHEIFDDGREAPYYLYYEYEFYVHPHPLFFSLAGNEIRPTLYYELLLLVPENSQ